MSVSGLCQICEARQADEQCDNCGSLVCQTHYDRGSSLCADCTTELNPADPEDVDIHRF